jgi:transcriptional regulator with XRE-family HTH domain
MWRDKFLHEMEKSGYTTKQFAEISGVSENTIKRIKKDANATIQLVTLEQIAKGFGLDLKDLTNDTNTVVGTVKLEVLQEELNKAIADNNLLITERNLLKTENSTLIAQKELLEVKLMYTEKLLSVYEKFDKFNKE